MPNAITHEPILVNAFWLEQFLSFAGWGIDTDDHPLNKLNMENESSQAILVTTYLLPEFKQLNPVHQFRAKEILRYAINYFTASEWEAWTDQVLPDISSDPTGMFINVWGIMFFGEPWLIGSKDRYIRTDDRRNPLDPKRFVYIDMRGH